MDYTQDRTTEPFLVIDWFTIVETISLYESSTSKRREREKAKEN
jgi:hypothetical protein